MLELCCEKNMSGYVCLITVSQRISREPPHPPHKTHTQTLQANLTSVQFLCSTSVASVSSHQYEQIIRALRGLSINPSRESSFHSSSLPSSFSILASAFPFFSPFSLLLRGSVCPQGTERIATFQERLCVCERVRTHFLRRKGSETRGCGGGGERRR